MPKGDKTGPIGKGAMTGRGLGKCAGNKESGFENNTGRGKMGLGHGHHRPKNGGGHRFGQRREENF